MGRTCVLLGKRASPGTDGSFTVVRRPTVAWSMVPLAVTQRTAPRVRLPGAALRVATGVVAAGICAVAVVMVASGAPPDERFSRGLTGALIIGLPVAVGLYATTSARTFRFGLLLVGAGLVWSLTALAESPQSLPYSIGRVSASLIFPILVYLMLAYPENRIAARGDRRLFAATVLVIALLYTGTAPFVEGYPADTPWATCTTDCPANAFLVLDAEPGVVSQLVVPLRELLSLLLLSAVTYSLIGRWRAASPLRRHTIGPVIAMSAVSTGCLALVLLARRAGAADNTVQAVGVVWGLTIAGIAAAFLIGLARRRMLVAQVLTRLSLALSSSDPRELRSTLALALDDPDVDLIVPEDIRRRRIEVAGRGRVVTPIEDDRGPVAALVHDASLRDDAELLGAVSALVLATLQHERMTSRLAASLRELEDSRKRIARAADIERSRIERDLHDGAQQRLIGLRIKLSLAEELAQADPAAGVEAMHDLGDEVDLTLEELRSLAHGVYPSLLSDRGVSDALHSILAESPLPARILSHGVTRLPPEVETAIYFTCLEAVQNAIKHAHGASGLWVSLYQSDAFSFEVRDDGIGFAPPNGSATGGLRNMRDRVEAVGGELAIDSGPGSGTRVRGVVPLP
jgi:signal transduction histidine kinase